MPDINVRPVLYHRTCELWDLALARLCLGRYPLRQTARLGSTINVSLVQQIEKATLYSVTHLQ